MTIPRSLEASDADQRRFWSKVKVGPMSHLGTECWVWTAYTDRKGYGVFKLGSKPKGTARTVRAHRLAFVLSGREIPLQGAGQVDHVCRNTSCVRPTHLEGVSCAENRRRQHHAIQDYFDRIAEEWEEAQEGPDRPLAYAVSAATFDHDDDF